MKPVPASRAAPRAKSSTSKVQRQAQSEHASLRQAVAAPGSASPQQLLQLQRLVGNRAANAIIQAKLEVGPADDSYEQEADRVAAEVTSSGPATTPQPTGVQRMAPDELQTQRDAHEAGFDAGPEVEGRIAANQGGGRPLPEDTRAELEPRFGADFSGVRVHTGGESAQLSRALSAEAFTHGQDIYFGQGQYSPETGSGKQLLAHELTHVVQQGHGGVQRKPVAADGISVGQVAPGSRLQLARGKFGRFMGSLAGSGISTPLFAALTPFAPLLGLAGGGYLGAKAALGKKNGRERKWSEASGWRKFGAVMAGIGGALGGAIAAPILTALMAIPGVAGHLAAKMTYGTKLMGSDTDRQAEANEDVQPNNPMAKVSNIEIETDSYVLRGRKYEPGDLTLRKRPEQLPGLGKRIVLLSGSGGPNENQLSSLGEFYAKQGATVYAVNYRGFGKGAEASRDKGLFGRETSPYTSEEGLYNDAYRIYQHARTDGGAVSANKIIVHGFSLGGAIAANLVKRVKEQDGESLGGLVLHSSIKSAYAAARDMIGIPVVGQLGGAVTHLSAGGFDTPEALAQIAQIDPRLPLHLMSGSGEQGDQLALSETGMTGDWARGLGFSNVSESEGLGGHLSTESHLLSNNNQEQLKTLLGTGRPEPQWNENPMHEEAMQWAGTNPMYEGV